MSDYINAMKGTGRGGAIVSSSGSWREAFKPRDLTEDKPFEPLLLKALQTVEVRVKGSKQPMTLERIADGRVSFADEHGGKVYDGSPGMRKLFKTLALMAEG